MTEDETKLLLLYRKMMLEVPRRVATIEKLVNQETGMEARFARESSFLQLRMLVENIALGCIIAHEGLSPLSAPKLSKEYAADRIVNELERLHPLFYPRPIIVTRQQDGHASVVDNCADHLTKQELVRLNSRCGDILHRGTPKRILAGEQIDNEWIAEVMGAAQKIVGLLWSHAMVMHGGKRALFCNLNTQQISIGDAL